MPSQLFNVFANKFRENTGFDHLLPRGRRACKLEIIRQFWALDKPSRSLILASAQQNPELEVDSMAGIPDPFDFQDPPNLIVSKRGIIVRTDFSDDNAWDSFCKAVSDSEIEGVKEMQAGQQAEEDDGEDGDESSSEDEEAQAPDTAGSMPDDDVSTPASDDDTPSSFIIFSAPEHRSILEGASNLSLLRLFNDVSLVHAPPKPKDATEKPIQHVLVDRDGLQEAYEGRLLWVYDQASNRDQSVRAVSLQGQTYGSATADSWRARAPFIWELQLNVDAGTMRIDFNYDYDERARNFAVWG
ncbi:hypothetical protein SISSUDRAFT_1042889 [Sistotremastrum suecicum HHB10207 ss-3]|uniref:Uncharacterized protein n=1 Tax=Sistotremastrum suecicum HHB10207 ss-3 TaxID=1314776 RepID=A0A166GC17_9AGAM|nr:hypothetical protein SISSUDRAFT_1042889 [Sistotremastrum suecicum HHB10207 ss-3]